jgi:hypothetical protein
VLAGFLDAAEQFFQGRRVRRRVWIDGHAHFDG